MRLSRHQIKVSFSGQSAVHFLQLDLDHKLLLFSSYMQEVCTWISPKISFVSKQSDSPVEGRQRRWPCGKLSSLPVFFFRYFTCIIFYISLALIDLLDVAEFSLCLKSLIKTVSQKPALSFLHVSKLNVISDVFSLQLYLMYSLMIKQLRRHDNNSCWWFGGWESAYWDKWRFPQGQHVDEFLSCFHSPLLSPALFLSIFFSQLLWTLTPWHFSLLSHGID